MEKMKPYRNEGCAFIHDDRGRFSPLGSVAWLHPKRAQAIINEGILRGAPCVIVPVDDDDSVLGRGPLSPLSADKTPAEHHCRDDLIARFLSLHHSRRKKLARLLGAKGRIKAKDADAFIKSADFDALKNHSELLGD